MTEKQLVEIIRRYYIEAGSLRRAAPRLGIGAMHLCDILRGRRRAGERVLKALGLKRVTTIVSSVERAGER